jgi:hypothetical protein
MNPSSIPSQLFSVDSPTEATRRDERIHTDDGNIIFPLITYHGIKYHHAILNIFSGICSFYQVQGSQSILVNKLAVKVDLLPINSKPVQFDEP